MSLINDALKRTRDAAYQAGPQPPPPQANYQMPAPAKTSATGILKLLLAGAVVLIMAGGILWWFIKPPPPAPVVVKPQVRKPAAAPVVSVQPVVVEAPKVEPASAPAPVPVPTPVPTPAAPTPAPVAVVAPASLPEPPRLVLQGIMSNGSKREALINGVSLEVGEEYQGVKVTAIESRRVKVQFGDREIVLRMP